MRDGIGFLIVAADPEPYRSALEQAGYAALAPDGLDIEGDDRAVLKQLEEALGTLAERDGIDSDRLVALGAGRGGTVAFMLGCTSSKLGAVVTSSAPMIYSELSSERPMQPLEMALNLSCPLLAFRGEEDALEAGETERIEQVLSQFFRTFDIVTHPGNGPLLAGKLDHDAPALDRIASFLEEAFELE